MEKKKFKIVTAAVILIGVGLLFVLGAYPLGGRPVYAVGSFGVVTWKDVLEGRSEKLKTVSLEKTRLDSFQNIELSSDFGDILIEEGEDFYLEYFFANTNTTPFYEVKDHTLTFKKGSEVAAGSNGEFYFINMGIGGMHGMGVIASNENDGKENYIKLYLPANYSLDDVTLRNSNGSISWKESGTARQCLVENDFGDITLGKIKCKNLEINLSNGELNMSGIEAEGKISAEVDFGRSVLENVSGPELKIQNSNGDTEIKQLKTEKLAQFSDFGNVTLEDITCGTAQLQNSNGSLWIGGSKFQDFKSESDFFHIFLEDSVVTAAVFENNNGEIRAERAEFDALEISNEFGDVELSLNGQEEQYFYQLECEYGDIILNGEDCGEKFKWNKSAGKILSVKNSNGAIEIQTK